MYAWNYVVPWHHTYSGYATAYLQKFSAGFVIPDTIEYNLILNVSQHNVY